MITITIKEHRMRFSGYCWRSREQMISEVLLWEPLHGQRKPGRPQKMYTAQLRNDSGYTTYELKMAMGDRHEWRKCVMLCRASFFINAII